MKLALLGGTFDPVHYGHLALAEAARTQLQADKVLFIPAFIPPHKMQQSITSLDHRVAMLQWAIAKQPSYEVCLIEAQKKKKCYTVDTLRELKAVYPADTQLFFLVGSDFLYDYHTWKDPEELVTLATFVVAPRPGFDVMHVPRSMMLLQGSFPGVASRTIRSKIKQGEDITSFVPAIVNEYIKEHKVYKKS